MDTQYKAVGRMWFCLTADETSCGYSSYAESIEDMIAERTKYNRDPEYIDMVTNDVKESLTNDTCDIISGLQFLEAVLSGSIMNYDGWISKIYVDRHESNLGLLIANKGFIDGKFLVDEYTFREICAEHTVEVDWVNK
jgi:hypothetical protein